MLYKFNNPEVDGYIWRQNSGFYMDELQRAEYMCCFDIGISLTFFYVFFGGVIRNYAYICIIKNMCSMNRITFIWTCFSAFCDVGRRISAFTGRRIGVLALCLSALFCGFAAKGQTVSELGYYLGAYGKNAKIQQLGSGTDAVIRPEWSH